MSPPLMVLPAGVGLQRGHAAPPGTGPAGETCGTCKHGSGQLGRVACKASGSRDTVRARDPACRRWEPCT